jgi:hypothetical protein
MTKQPCGAVQRETRALAIINIDRTIMNSFLGKSSKAERWRAPNAPVARSIKIPLPELVARQMHPEAKRSRLTLKDVALRHILQSMGLTPEIVEAYSRAPKAPGETQLDWKGIGGSGPDETTQRDAAPCAIRIGTAS